MAALSISDLLSLLCADGAASALLLERPAPAWPSGTRALLALAASREALERAADGLRGGTLYQQALAAGLDECVLDFLSSVADCEARLLDGDGGGGGEGSDGVDAEEAEASALVDSRSAAKRLLRDVKVVQDARQKAAMHGGGKAGGGGKGGKGAAAPKRR